MGNRWGEQDPLIAEIIGGEIEVHKALGPGFLCACRLDLLINDTVIAQIKAVETLLPAHGARLLSYLRLMSKRVGLLSFHTPYLKDSILRRVL